MPDPVNPERPAWLPPKFKTVEDLAKSYTELERKFGEAGHRKGHETVSAPGPTGDPEETAKSEAIEQTAQTDDDLGLVPELEISEPEKVTPTPKPPAEDPELARKGVSDALQRAIQGQLDEATLATFEKAGIGREHLQAIASQMKQGQAALQQLAQQEATKDIGGVEVWEEVSQWAGENLSPQKMDAFNEMLGSRNPEVVKAAVETLHHLFEEDQGPQLISGSGLGSDPGDVFRSHAEIQRAMSDPRYEKDPAYRAEVANKVLRSDYSKFKT
jgi:hypothetical protein